MTTPNNAPLMSPAEASVRLSKLIEKELGKVLTPVQLRGFIGTHWTKVSLFAHVIHNGEQHVQPRDQ